MHAIDSTMPYLADCLLMFIPTGTIPSSLKSYIQGETPLSTWATVISMIVTYLIVVFGMREIMRDRAPLKLTDPFRAHSFFCLGRVWYSYCISEESRFKLD